jgi:hypothetical protein
MGLRRRVVEQRRPEEEGVSNEGCQGIKNRPFPGRGMIESRGKFHQKKVDMTKTCSLSWCAASGVC